NPFTTVARDCRDWRCGGAVERDRDGGVGSGRARAAARRAARPRAAPPVKNAFFGGNIGVTGLLTGGDVAAALAGQSEHDRYLLPDVALSRGRFLDGTTAAHLPRVVEIVPTDGAALVRALRRPST